jgi:hypothetical protein
MKTIHRFKRKLLSKLRVQFIVSALLCMCQFLWIYELLPSADAAEHSSTLLAPESEQSTLGDSPFYSPQTNFVFGKISHNLTLYQGDVSHQIELNQAGVFSTFGFDVEINQSRWLNIGIYARFSSASGLLDPTLPAIAPNTVNEISCTMGGFIRPFYILPFLSGRTSATSLFGRFDLGGGPSFLPAQWDSISGLMLQTALHLGVETYLNRWLGLGISYGMIYEWGAVTTGKSGNFFNQGSEVIVSLKTTLF